MNACTRRHRWSLPPDRSSIMNWSTSPSASDPALLASGVFESILVTRGQDHSPGCPSRPLGQIAAASCTDTGFQMILLARRTSWPQRHAEASLGSLSAFSPGPPKAGWTSSWTPARSATDRSSSTLRHSLATRPLMAAQVDRALGVGRGRGGGQPRRCRSSLRRARPDITETSRGNIFIQDQHGSWCTPPLDEQVLPGMTRREVHGPAR